MAERTHNINSTTRIKINTIGTVLPGFVEWGGEARRERKKRILFWTYWSTEGSSPNFTVDFVGADRTTRFAEVEVNASNETRAGYRKRAIVSINASGGPQTSAHFMTNVILHYVINGENKTLAHNPL